MNCKVVIDGKTYNTKTAKFVDCFMQCENKNSINLWFKFCRKDGEYFILLYCIYNSDDGKKSNEFFIYEDFFGLQYETIKAAYENKKLIIFPSSKVKQIF